MPNRVLRKIGIGLAALATIVAGLVVPTAPASAAPGCTLTATLPSKIVIKKKDTIFYSTLKGSGNCNPAGGDFWGAVAYFDGPEGAWDYPYWERIGDKYRFDMYAWDATAGTYTLRDGEGYVEDVDFDLVPVTWKNSSTKIKFGSRVIKYTTERSGRKVTISGKVQRYTDDAEYAGHRVKVSLQRKTHLGKTYSHHKTLRANRSGKVSYSYKSKKKYYYRIVVKDTRTVWRTKSKRSYR